MGYFKTLVLCKYSIGGFSNDFKIPFYCPFRFEITFFIKIFAQDRSKEVKFFYPMVCTQFFNRLYVTFNIVHNDKDIKFSTELGFHLVSSLITRVCLKTCQMSR